MGLLELLRQLRRRRHLNAGNSRISIWQDNFNQISEIKLLLPEGAHGKGRSASMTRS